MTQASLPALVAAELLRLEAAVDAARRAPQAPAVPVGELLGRPLRLAPHVQLLHLQTDAVRTLADPTDGRRKTRRRERHVVVFRFGGEVRVQVWPELGWRLLQGIDELGDYGAAVAHALGAGMDAWTLDMVRTEWLRIFAWRGLVEAAEAEAPAR